MYAKVFSQILDSSLADDYQIRHVFEDLLKLADKLGVVDMTPRAIAGRTGMPLDMVLRGIEELEKADPESRTPDEDGRRILRLDSHRNWGWKITNYEKYSAIRDEESRRSYQAHWVKEKRESKKMSTENVDTVSTESRQSTMSTPVSVSVPISIPNEKQIPSDSPYGSRPNKSKSVRDPDPRHTQFQEAFGKYFIHKNASVTQAPWDAQEASHLGRFLKKNPEFTIDQWQRLLRNRGNSPVSHGDALSAWVGRSLNWADGPTDAYGKKPGGSNGNYKSKTESSIDAACEAIRIINARGADCDGVDEARYAPASQAKYGGLPRLSSGSGLF